MGEVVLALGSATETRTFQVDEMILEIADDWTMPELGNSGSPLNAVPIRFPEFEAFIPEFDYPSVCFAVARVFAQSTSI
jgi:hypothetical protein